MIGAGSDSATTLLRDLLVRAAVGTAIRREPEVFRAGAVPERYGRGPEEWEAEGPIEGVAS